MHFATEPDRAVQLLRERVFSAIEHHVIPNYPVVELRIGADDGGATAAVSAATAREALQRCIAQLITVEGLRDALKAVPVEAAAREIVDATLEGVSEAEVLVETMRALSRAALTVAFVRKICVGERFLFDPAEVGEQASVGAGEFVFGWWEIRDSLAEPARQWVELLESRFPKALRR